MKDRRGGDEMKDRKKGLEEEEGLNVDRKRIKSEWQDGRGQRGGRVRTRERAKLVTCDGGFDLTKVCNYRGSAELPYVGSRGPTAHGEDCHCA